MSYEEQEFQDLLNAACDDRLTLEQAARLEAIIANDPEACQRYDQYMQLDLEVHFLARSLPEPAAAPELHEVVQADHARVPLGRKSLLTLRYWRVHPGRFVALAAALTLLMWFGFYHLVRPYLPDGQSASTASQFAAQVTGGRQVQWAADAKPWADQAYLPRHSVLEIESGMLEIRFADGAVVMLEGPARLVAAGPKSGRLDYGRLVARADSIEARGFFVTTPLAQVIDLGTEFGVESSEAHGTEVEVFEGSVEATPTARGEDHRLHSLRLAAGQAASLAVGASEFVRREAEPERYVQSMPPAGAELPNRLIRPVAVSCSVEDEFSRPAGRLIDGSGLVVGTGGGSRVHWGGNPEACCGDGDLNCWIVRVDVRKPPVLTFDLGQEYELSGIHLWNYTHAEIEVGPFLSAREIRVSVSSDGEQFEPTGVAWATGPENLAAGEQFVETSGRARYVRFELASNQTPVGETPEPYVGLGEVRFEGRPFSSEADSE